MPEIGIEIPVAELYEDADLPDAGNLDAGDAHRGEDVAPPTAITGRAVPTPRSRPLAECGLGFHGEEAL